MNNSFLNIDFVKHSSDNSNELFESSRTVQSFEFKRNSQETFRQLFDWLTLRLTHSDRH